MVAVSLRAPEENRRPLQFKINPKWLNTGQKVDRIQKNHKAEGSSSDLQRQASAASQPRRAEGRSGYQNLKERCEEEDSAILEEQWRLLDGHKQPAKMTHRGVEDQVPWLHHLPAFWSPAEAFRWSGLRNQVTRGSFSIVGTTEQRERQRWSKEKTHDNQHNS